MACCATSLAQKRRFIGFTVSDGLSQNSAHCIYQDSDGIIWIGTQDGLNMFDGHSFTTFRHNAKDSNSISDQFVLSIAEDRRGQLWVGTRNGLNRFNKYTQQFSRYYFSDSAKQSISHAYPMLTRNAAGEIYVQGSTPAVIDTNGSLLVDPKALR
ncbi:MAG TPA: two-component regulator propeller domain-containing protein, partial [Chitinophagaceae bacterium]|nr:two-component regulator propeller domain-containing protein [Chitinophagaceae bacterium]